MKCDGTRAETRFRLSAKRTSLFKSAGASVQSTTGSRGVRISGSNAGYTMFRGSVRGTGYPLHSPVSPSLPLLCVTVCHHISTGVYRRVIPQKSAVLINLYFSAEARNLAAYIPVRTQLFTAYEIFYQRFRFNNGRLTSSPYKHGRNLRLSVSLSLSLSVCNSISLPLMAVRTEDKKEIQKISGQNFRICYIVVAEDSGQ